MKLLIKRVLAYSIDLFTTTTILLINAFTFQISILETNLLNAYLMIISTLASIFFLLIYLPTIKQGQTLGKLAMNIKTVHINNQRLTFFDNFVREFIFKYILAFIFIPYALIVKFYYRLKKQPTIWLHDLICNTKVIEK